MTNPNPAAQPDAEENDLIIFPQLFDSDPKTRLLGLYGEVNEESCKQAITGLYYFRDTGKIEEEFDSEEDEETFVKTSYLPVEFIVSTEGGSVTDMFALYDCMREVRKECDIIAFGVGKVMSAGVLLLAGGTKGKRKVGRNCRLMLHALAGGHFGSLKELETDIKEVKWYQSQYITALAEETNLTEKKIRSMFRKKTDTYFNAEQAIEWGIADEMV
jgi:ATP-dependent Clp endopeptidase proteolytic subunit ClpP